MCLAQVSRSHPGQPGILRLTQEILENPGFIPKNWIIFLHRENLFCKLVAFSFLSYNNNRLGVAVKESCSFLSPSFGIVLGFLGRACRIGLMESRVHHRRRCRGGPPHWLTPPGWQPPPKVAHDDAGCLMESCLSCCHGGPPWLADPPTPPPPPPLRDGWLGRSASTLTKRTCSSSHSLY